MSEHGGGKTIFLYSVNKWSTNGQRHKMIYSVRGNSGNNTFPCNLCEKTFSQRSYLTSHMSRIHVLKPFSCDLCEKAFKKRSDLNKHRLIHTQSDEKPFSCDVCKKTFRCTSHLKSHILIHTGEKPFSCNVCKKTFSQKGSLKSHSLIHTEHVQSDGKPFSCDVCKKTFTRKGNLRSHRLIHTGEKPFSCDVCKKTFSRKSNLNLHILNHASEKPFSCDVCKKTFTQRCNLNTHTRLVHTDERPFPCDVCKKTFRQRSNLKAHTLTHTVEKPFSCDACKKTFRQSGALKRHKQIHNRKKAYPDDISLNIFSLKHNTTDHRSEEPFCWDVCKETFTKKPSLLNHMETLSGGKPLSCNHCCDVCQKTFRQRSSLNSHRLIHTGENPCYVCKKTFSQRNHLTEHMTTHTGETNQSKCGKGVSCVLSSKIPSQNTSLVGGSVEYYRPSSCVLCDKTVPSQRKFIGRLTGYRDAQNSNYCVEESMKRTQSDVHKSKSQTETLSCSVSDNELSTEKFYTDVATLDVFCEQCLWTPVLCDLCDQEIPCVVLRNHLEKHVGILG